MLALIAVTADGWNGTRARRPMDDSRALACNACMSALHPSLHFLQMECQRSIHHFSLFSCNVPRASDAHPACHAVYNAHLLSCVWSEMRVTGQHGMTTRDAGQNVVG